MTHPSLPSPDDQTHPIRGTLSRAVLELPPIVPEVPASSPPPLAESKAPSVPAESVAVVCPRCGGKLMNPESLGWCKGCGYCRSLEEERARVPLPKSTGPGRSSPLGVAEFFRLFGYLPQWLWVMLAGVGVIAVFSLPPRVSLPEEGLPRCLWSTIQLGIGILMILAAQLWALLVLADTDERLSYKDAIFSGRLWGLTLWKLPATRQQLWLGAWGIAAILSALFLIGGLSHWFTYLPRSATAEPAAVEQETK